MERKIRDNRGLSLIELIVSLAIASIVVLAIGTLMSVGTRSYYSTSAETELQKESQIALNQINDLLIKAQEYQLINVNVVGKGSISTLVITGAEADDTGNAQVYHYAIIFDKDRNQLLFQKILKSSLLPDTLLSWLEEVVKKEVESITPSLLAKYIQSLTITPDNIIDNDQGIAQVKLELSLGDKTYSTFSTISIRNH